MASELYATLTTTLGPVRVKLFPDHAPKTVRNFVGLADGSAEWTDPRTGKKADGPLYAGTVFHRVIAGFMIQGGGFDKAMRKKKTRAPVVNEAANGLKNDVGTIAMARTSDPNSATAQFFINHKNNDFLNHSAPTAQGWGYTVFGKVTKGMDVVNKIAALRCRCGVVLGTVDLAAGLPWSAAT